MSFVAMLPIANHLWQSTLFAIAVWLTILTLRKNAAAVRHRLWLVASVKFLIPFSFLANIGRHFQWETPLTTSTVSMIVSTVSQPFSAAGPAVEPPDTASAILTERLLAVLIGLWISGIAASSFWWFIRWWRVRRAVRLAEPLNLDWPFRVVHSRARFEPGVFGIRVEDIRVQPSPGETKVDIDVRIREKGQ